MKKKPVTSDLEKRFTFTFTKRELVIMANLIVQNQYKIGDARVILPLFEKIEPYVLQDSNIPTTANGAAEEAVNWEDKN